MSTSDTFTIGKNTTVHGVRGRQLEYMASVGKRVTVGEAFCGRKSGKLSRNKVARIITCKACIKAAK